MLPDLFTTFLKVGPAVKQFAIYYAPEAFVLGREVLMGRQSAGAGFLRAIANYGPEALWCYSGHPMRAEECAEALRNFGCPKTQVHFVPFLNSRLLGNAGLLYRPDPGIMSDGWRRLNSSNSRAYSICGVTHTTASHPIMGAIAALLTAPLEDWDAIICTSTCVRDTIRSILDNQADFLRERVGATRLTLPQLPVIPLGTHTSDFKFSAEQRAAARQQLGIEPDEVVFLYLGRLSHLDKANPIPMYLALERCSPGNRIRLIEAGWFSKEDTKQAFTDDAQTLCPSVNRTYLDGRDPQQREQAWAAADIFTSLTDNVQETFGLTPIEAMAAGLPVVVSDWDGYKETVRDGIDGFRIPTMSMPSGTGQALADFYEMGVYDYHKYCGSTSQLVAVDVSRAADAYSRLIKDADLRHKMGAAGQERAHTEFDWVHVFRKYVDLWEELEERRRSGPTLYPASHRRQRPDRMDPFTIFGSYPTSSITPEVRIKRHVSANTDVAVSRRDLHTTKFASPLLPQEPVISEILGHLRVDDWSAFGDLLKSRPVQTRQQLLSAVVWLSKIGMIEFQLPKHSSGDNKGV